MKFLSYRLFRKIGLVTRMKSNSTYSVFLLVLSFIAQTQAQEALLRWNNGDVLPGTLLESGPAGIRWSSSMFADELVLDTNALDSIAFPMQPAQAREAFRVGTTAGDVFTADLVGASDEALLFSSLRHGRFQVRCGLIYSLRRIANPNLVFVGSQFEEWQRFMDGPIRNLSYEVFQGDWTWGTPFPDLTALTPVDTARFAAGYLDLGLSRFQSKFAMSFQGDFVAPATGKYRFEGTVDDQAHLWIDGKKIRNDAEIANRHRSAVELARGYHSLRLDYIDLGGVARLSFWMVNARGEYTSLAESNQTSGWQRGISGHPQTYRKKASLFRRVELPENFEIDLELASSSSPQFVLAIGKEKPSDESKQSLRLETWGDELVVVQDTVFEPVMTLTKAMRELRLQLAYDSQSRVLQVFDASGGLLAQVKGVQATSGQSGITLRNRGEDLSVRRLSVYRRSSASTRRSFDAARARVHLMDGQVLYGRLHVAAHAAYVEDQAGARHEIDLNQVDRVARPGVPLTVTTKLTELSYADGAILYGRIEQANAHQVILRTTFSDQPVTCVLAGASLLRFGPSSLEVKASGEDMDQLFNASGRLRGQLSFDRAGAPLSWQAPGAAQPLRLASGSVGRIERRSRAVKQGPAFDTEQFPCLLHLRSGEIIPCQVLSYDQRTLGFESPFIEQRQLDALHIKAIEFLSPERRDTVRRPASRTETWLDDILGPEQQSFFGIDSVKLKRALTVPRFNRNSPPSHILMANNGDLKRGSLLGLNTRTIQFESKLRTQTIPLTRLARVVNVRTPQQDPRAPFETPIDMTGKVRASLADGSVLVFAPLEAKDGKLIGRSAIYGDMAIPGASIQELHLGDFEEEHFKSLFAAWVSQPAQEPAFGKASAPLYDAQSAEELAVPSPEVTPPGPSRALDIGPGVDIDTVLDPNAPTLGKVHVNARDRSVRFPVTISKRSGPVKYALVTEQGKTQEGVFRTDAQPLHIHLGLLLLGITPSYVRELAQDPAATLPGEPVAIYISWVKDGVEHSRPLEYFVVTTRSAARLSRGPWVYNGSVMTDTGLAAQSTGSIVSVCLDPSALINNPRPGREDTELHQANPEAFPSGPTEFQMEIRLVWDKDSG
jgi:hypothetical protein